MPTENDRPQIQQIVIEEMHERWALGRERYKTGLQVGNGRDMVRDMLEEVQDLLVYATGVRERDKEIVQVLEHLLETFHGEVDGYYCACNARVPCHQRTDIEQVLHLLGR